MSKANSPTYRDGCEDGRADTERISACPPQIPRGPQPPNPAYPVMYMMGYREEFRSELAHRPCENCRNGRGG